jgi:hypothetical protein
MVDAGGGSVGRLPPEHGAENTARIARSAMKVAICRTSLRSVLYPAIVRRRWVIDRSYDFRPLSDRIGMWRFAGVYATWWKPRSVRSVFQPALLIAHDRCPCILLPERYRCTLPATIYTLYEDADHLVVHTRLKRILCASGIAADTAFLPLPRVFVGSLACAPTF